MGVYPHATLLFAQSSFTEGMARAVDLWGFMGDYNYSATSELADFHAICSDWYAVGDDLRQAILDVQARQAA